MDASNRSLLLGVVATSAAVGAVMGYSLSNSCSAPDRTKVESLEKEISELKRSVKSSRKKNLSEQWRALPQRIILVRHGQSEGNVNHHVYTYKSDSQLELTKKGIQQATEAGKNIKSIVGDKPVIAFVSPFERAMETLLCIERSLDASQLVEVHSDPRIREAERNNLQTPATVAEKEDYQAHMRKYREAKAIWNESVKSVASHPFYPKYASGSIEFHEDMAERLGRFYYRRPNGESCADVYDRCGDFLNSIIDSDGHHMLCNKFNPDCEEEWRQRGEYSTLIVTHGLTMRLMLMRYFSMSVDTFQTIWNARNCNIWTLRKNETTRRYEICPEESFPHRVPWATREVVVNLKGKERATGSSSGPVPPPMERKKVTVVDYLTIPQPRSSHPEMALKLMVEGHNIHHINRKVLDHKRRVLTEPGAPDIPLLKIDPKRHHSIDWWASTRVLEYPPWNSLSEQARNLRTNVRILRREQRRRSEMERPPGTPKLKPLASLWVGGKKHPKGS